MPAEEQTRLQIGHVLFIDVAGYSKLLVNQQSELLRELNEVYVCEIIVRLLELWKRRIGQLSRALTLRYHVAV